MTDGHTLSYEWFNPFEIYISHIYTCAVSRSGINVKLHLESPKEPCSHIQYRRALPRYKNWYIQKAVNASAVKRPHTIMRRTVEGKEQINKVKKNLVK